MPCSHFLTCTQGQEEMQPIEHSLCVRIVQVPYPGQHIIALRSRPFTSISPLSFFINNLLMHLLMQSFHASKLIRCQRLNPNVDVASAEELPIPSAPDIIYYAVITLAYIMFPKCGHNISIYHFPNGFIENHLHDVLVVVNKSNLHDVYPRVQPMRGVLYR